MQPSGAKMYVRDVAGLYLGKQKLVASEVRATRSMNLVRTARTRPKEVGQAETNEHVLSEWLADWRFAGVLYGLTRGRHWVT